jgi:hypothetical protein
MDARTFAVQYNMIVADKKVGKLADVSYDLRKPPASRFKSRTWIAEAPIINKRWYGWRYDFNLYAIVRPLKWRQARSKVKQ